MNPRSRDERKIYLVCLQKTFFLNDNNKPAHWLVHSKLISLDIDELFKRTQHFVEKEASVTRKTEEEKNTARKL